MSINEEFDELARRKLEERTFAYEGADWADARRLIDAKRSQRRRVGIGFFTGLLLLTGGLLWHGLRTAPPAPLAATAHNGPDAAAIGTSSSTAGPGTGTASANASNDGGSVPVPEIAPTTAATASAPTGPTIPAVAPSRTIRTPKNNAGRAAEKVLAAGSITAPAAANTSATVPTSVVRSDRSDVLAHAEDRPSDGNVSTTSTNDEVVHTRVEQAEATAQPDDGTKTPGIGSVPVGPPLPAVGSIPLVGTPFHAMEQDTTDASAGPKRAEQTAKAVGDRKAPEAADTLSPAPAVAEALPADSTGPIAPPPVASPPIVPERAPWELGMLGGVFACTSTYAGGNSAEWAGNVSGERSIGIGAEIMHMGRNIGIGVGVHYGSYTERLRTDARDAIHRTYQGHWFLAPVDTAILVITDTLPGPPTSYAGTSVDTTVYILAHGIDTITTSTHLRDAMDRLNRTTYLEVPILLDVHLVQGRWSFGLRGGPTIGLLTGRIGSVPNSTEDGYVAFTDQAFQEVVFGYTARAYARYRFNAAWSVGLGPMLRGQLMDSYGPGALQRRSSAKGVVLSLTYRLR